MTLEWKKTRELPWYWTGVFIPLSVLVCSDGKREQIPVTPVALVAHYWRYPGRRTFDWGAEDKEQQIRFIANGVETGAPLIRSSWSWLIRSWLGDRAADQFNRAGTSGAGKIPFTGIHCRCWKRRVTLRACHTDEQKGLYHCNKFFPFCAVCPLCSRSNKANALVKCVKQLPRDDTIGT